MVDEFIASIWRYEYIVSGINPIVVSKPRLVGSLLLVALGGSLEEVSIVKFGSNGKKEAYGSLVLVKLVSKSVLRRSGAGRNINVGVLGDLLVGLFGTSRSGLVDLVTKKLLGDHGRLVRTTDDLPDELGGVAIEGVSQHSMPALGEVGSRHNLLDSVHCE